MSGSAFDPSFDDLPSRLPVFPLTGVLLLPGGRLPLNIFEPRYLAMTRHALGHGQMIGMIQPQDGAGDVGNPPLYRTGCMGRITEFQETDDGRYLINLKGCARFDVASEPPRANLFRIVEPDWRRYAGDLEETEPEIERDRLVAALKPYFRRRGIDADFAAIAKAPAERLVASLAMMCPFEPREKQALLEAADATARSQLLVTLIEMATVSSGGGDAGPARH
ncbi:MAG TPA: LON peptidase substrate-binding domain-containing protein [Stellaceae bacterium]|nr:LON peptidase substrate-binding domain-containing protein [Stellaceae bacterium]